MRNNLRKNLQDFRALLRFITVRFVQDRCSQTAASLTFTTLLSLVPLMTIALTMFSAFPVFDSLSEQIKTYLMKNLMPDTAGVVITKYMQQFTDSAARLTTVGIGFLALTAMSMMLTIDHAFNIIWRVTRSRPLVKRLVVYWAVLTLAPLLIGASLSLTSWLIGLSMGYAKHIPLFGVGVLKILPILFATLAFALLFRLVPNRYVPRSHAFIGALVAAVLFETMNRIFGYYVSHFPSYKLVYGAFASVPIFLLWIYLSWLTILIGAEISASLSHWRAPMAQQLTTTTQLLDALRILKIMVNGFQQGKVSTFPAMSKTLHIGYDELEKILDKLASADIVRKAEGQGWLLMRDPNHIRAIELLHLFVLDSGILLAEHSDDPLRQWFYTNARKLEKSTDISLQELLTITST
ncbi:MAG: YihY family inner membrane protein [Gallionella sp.]